MPCQKAASNARGAEGSPVTPSLPWQWGWLHSCTVLGATLGSQRSPWLWADPRAASSSGKDCTRRLETLPRVGFAVAGVVGWWPQLGKGP